MMKELGWTAHGDNGKKRGVMTTEGKGCTDGGTNEGSVNGKDCHQESKTREEYQKRRWQLSNLTPPAS